MQTIQVYKAAVGLTPQQFVETHPHPFVIYTGRPLRGVKQTRGLTVDRLVIEGDAATSGHPMTDDFLVGELVANDHRERVVTIGASSTCDVAVNDSSLSKQHAWFDRIGDEWRIWDNDSVAGTQVNGEPLKPGSPRTLASGDRIAMGYVDLTFLTAAGFHRLIKGLLG